MTNTVVQVGEVFIPKSLEVPPGTFAQRLAWANASEPVRGPNLGPRHFATCVRIAQASAPPDCVRVYAFHGERPVGIFLLTIEVLERDWERL